MADSNTTDQCPSSLPPGLVLDAEVAQEVYGATVYQCPMTWDDNGFPIWLAGRTFPCLVILPLGPNSKRDAVYYHTDNIVCVGWSPSTNAEHALKVAAALEKRGYWMQASSPWIPKHPEQYRGSAGKWLCGFTKHGEIGFNGKPDNLMRGDTFAHSVCLAALKLMEAMKDGRQEMGPEG